jgi:hypothetical protein
MRCSEACSLFEVPDGTFPVIRLSGVRRVSSTCAHSCRDGRLSRALTSDHRSSSHPSIYCF